MVLPNHKPLLQLRYTEDVSYGCHKISVQSLIQYIFILLSSSFLPIQSSPAHISYLYKAGVSWLALPLKAPHICLPETWNQWLLHMRQLHLHPCPSPNVTRSTYFGKKIFVFAKRSTYVDKEINTFITMRKLYIHHHPAPLYPQELSSAHPSSQISWKRLKVNKFSCRSCAI